MSGTGSAVGIWDGDGIPGYVRKHGSEELFLFGYVLCSIEGCILQESDVLFGLFSREYAFQSVLHDTDGETVGHRVVECGLDVLPGYDMESGKRFREDELSAYVIVRNIGYGDLRFGIYGEPRFPFLQDYASVKYRMRAEQTSDLGDGVVVGESLGNRIGAIDHIHLGRFPALAVEVDVQGTSGQGASRIECVDAFNTFGI